MSSPLLESPLASVVIGTFNRARLLTATIESVRAELEDVAHEILVVDGGSTDGTISWLVRQKDLVTIVQHNRGEWHGRPVQRKSWGYFMNLGFMAAHGTYVCMLSDDCVVVPGAIRNGIGILEREIAAQKPIGAAAFYFRDWPHERSYRVGRTFGDRLFVNHGVYLKSALETVGYADEVSYRFYHADGDLSLRMWEAGLGCVDSPDSFVEHHPDKREAVRQANNAVQQVDWSTYTSRWSALGEPTSAWTTREFTDPHATAERYWSPKRRLGRWLRK